MGNDRGPKNNQYQALAYLRLIAINKLWPHERNENKVHVYLY